MKAITTFLFVLNMMLTLNSIGGDITYVTSRGGINTGDTNSLQLPQSSSGSVNYISIDNRIVFSVNHDHDSINEVVDKVEVELHVEMKSIGGTRITDTIILELNNLVSGVHSRDIHIKTFQDQVEISYRVISSSASDKTGNTVALSPMQELFQLYMETTVRQVSLLSTAPINGSASLLVCDYRDTGIHFPARVSGTNMRNLLQYPPGFPQRTDHVNTRWSDTVHGDGASQPGVQGKDACSLSLYSTER
jgi:hypothetical protein